MSPSPAGIGPVCPECTYPLSAGCECGETVACAVCAREYASLDGGVCMLCRHTRSEEVPRCASCGGSYLPLEGGVCGVCSDPRKSWDGPPLGEIQVRGESAPPAPPPPPPVPPVGVLVSYQSPSWGWCTGRVLREGAVDGRVLVQDLSEHGAREWWPLAELEVVPATLPSPAGLRSCWVCSRTEAETDLQPDRDHSPGGGEWICATCTPPAGVSSEGEVALLLAHRHADLREVPVDADGDCPDCAEADLAEEEWEIPPPSCRSCGSTSQSLGEDGVCPVCSDPREPGAHRWLSGQSGLRVVAPITGGPVCGGCDRPQHACTCSPPPAPGSAAGLVLYVAHGPDGTRWGRPAASREAALAEAAEDLAGVYPDAGQDEQEARLLARALEERVVVEVPLPSGITAQGLAALTGSYGELWWAAGLLEDLRGVSVICAGNSGGAGGWGEEEGVEEGEWPCSLIGPLLPAVDLAAARPCGDS